MTQKDRPKLPLLVLAAGGILLCAAALQSVLIVGPGPGSSNPHAISVDTSRPAATPAPSSASHTEEPAPRVEADPATTGAVPDPPARHAIDLESPPAPTSPVEQANAPGVPPTDQAPKDKPAPGAAETGKSPETTPPAKVENAGGQTLSDAETSAASKVETPAEGLKPSPGPATAQIARAAEQTPASTTPSSAPEIKPVAPPKIEQAAGQPKIETPPAKAVPAAEPEPTQAVKSETVEETPESKAQPARVDDEPRQVKPATRAASEKTQVVAEAQSGRIAKPMSLGFGRLAKPSAPTSKASSSRYAASVRAAIGRHRPAAHGGGSATVAFSIGSAGGITGLRVVRSSGKPTLDQAAIATVRSAAPFPPPPAGVNPAFSIQIYFR